MKYTPKTVTMRLSPDLAREMVQGNIDNRLIRQSKISKLATAMTKGRWTLSHQGIAFTDDPKFPKWGRLLDGQHRLLAAIMSGKTIDILVTTGADPESYRIIDEVTPRTHYDRLHLVDDIVENKVICSALAAYYRNALSNNSPTTDELENEFLDHTDDWMWVAKALVGSKKDLNCAAIAAAFATYHGFSTAKATEFLQQYLSGAGFLTEDSPVLALREGMISKRTSKALAECYWKAISAFRAHAEGKKLSVLYSATRDLRGNEYSKLKHVRAKAASRKKAG